MKMSSNRFVPKTTGFEVCPSCGCRFNLLSMHVASGCKKEKGVSYIVSRISTGQLSRKYDSLAATPNLVVNDGEKKV